MDLLKVWSVSGGLPLKQRAQQRQAYRHQELRRWRELLGVPCNLEPAYHPVADRRACYLAIAAMQQGLDWQRLSYALLRAVWVEERNIADHPTLAAIADENGMDGKALLASTETAAVHAEYQANTDEAMALGVFGAPTYVFDGELFWGQDRLDMLEWRLNRSSVSVEGGLRRLAASVAASEDRRCAHPPHVPSGGARVRTRHVRTVRKGRHRGREQP